MPSRIRVVSPLLSLGFLAHLRARGFSRAPTPPQWPMQALPSTAAVWKSAETAVGSAVPVEAELLHLYPESGRPSQGFLVPGLPEAIEAGTCVHRFKIWWMRPRHILDLRNVPPETQMVLYEQQGRRDGLFELLVPVQQNGASATLQGAADGDGSPMLVVLDTGDDEAELAKAGPTGEAGEGLTGVLRLRGEDPFDLLHRAVRFGLRWANDPSSAIAALVASWEESYRQWDSVLASSRDAPPLMRGIGWCTWDSFYTHVTADRVREGLLALRANKVRPKFVIVDDGWQDTRHVDEDDDYVEPFVEITDQLNPPADHYPKRLRSPHVGRSFALHADGTCALDPADETRRMVTELKDELGVDSVLFWHALLGYWAGVGKDSKFADLHTDVEYPRFVDGILYHEPQLSTDVALTSNGGVGRPRILQEEFSKFYVEMHETIRSVGADGVKIDVQSAVSALGTTGAGGGGKLASLIHKALRNSTQTYFAGSGSPLVLHCMCHAPQVLAAISTHWRERPLLRGSDDFYPKQPASHAAHVHANAHNSLILAFIGHVDWDMFQSLLPEQEGENWSGTGQQWAWLHAAARAVSGGPVYISDRPGFHDVAILSALTLPDGSLTPPIGSALPTRDCILRDVTIPGNGPLVVWNVNPSGAGVLAAFNVAGTEWNAAEGRYQFAEVAGNDSLTPPETGKLSPGMVAAFGLTPEQGQAEKVFVVYRWSGQVHVMRGVDAIPFSIERGEFEIAAITELRSVVKGIEVSGSQPSFAVIGFPSMLNIGGGVRGVKVVDSAQVSLTAGATKHVVAATIHGKGELLMVATQLPSRVSNLRTGREYAIDAVDVTDKVFTNVESFEVGNAAGLEGLLGSRVLLVSIELGEDAEGADSFTTFSRELGIEF